MKVYRIFPKNRNLVEHLDPFDMMKGLDRPGAFALAAAPEGKDEEKSTAAGLMICRTGGNSLDIDWLYVDVNQRNKGYGDRLLSEAFNIASGYGFSHVTVCSGTDEELKTIFDNAKEYLEDRLFETEESGEKEGETLLIAETEEYFSDEMPYPDPEELFGLTKEA